MIGFALSSVFCALAESIDTFIARQKNSHQEQLIEYQTILQNVFKLPTKLALYCPAISQLIYL